MMPGICNYDPINGEIISAVRFKESANPYRFTHEEHATGIERLENFPEIQPERYRPISGPDIFNDSDQKERPLKEIAVILFIILPAAVIFLYLLIHALGQCLLGCFY